MQESSSQLKAQEGLILVLNQVSGVLCVCPAKKTDLQTNLNYFFSHTRAQIGCYSV